MGTLLVSKTEYVIDRIEKALYMGFLLDRESNDYLSGGFDLSFENIKKYISNYNKNLSEKGYPVRFEWRDDKKYVHFRVLGEYVSLDSDEIEAFIGRVTERLERNIALAKKSYSKVAVEVFDLDLLIPLECTGVTTMGDKYRAFNGKKYTVHFMHLYSVIEDY